MALISFDENKKRDVVLIGRVTLDFNPNELNRTLDKVKTFSMYLGGSPGNMAVGQKGWLHWMCIRRPVRRLCPQLL